MIPQIRFLFIGAPSRATTETQKLLALNCLPIRGHFEASTEEALDYLNNCSMYQFSDVIILDQQMGKKELKKMLQAYQQRFYIKHMDTLTFVSGQSSSLSKKIDNDSLVSGYFQQPFSKTIFLEQIYPLISVTMV